MSIDNNKSRTGLDYHANMAVIGLNALIINNAVRTTVFTTFTPDYEALHQVPIVDAVISYIFPYNDWIYILIIRYALSVTPMKKIDPTIYHAGILLQKSTP